jgi:hypothetical protein
MGYLKDGLRTLQQALVTLYIFRMTSSFSIRNMRPTVSMLHCPCVKKSLVHEKTGFGLLNRTGDNGHKGSQAIQQSGIS